MATNKVVTKVVADTSGHDSALRRSEAEVLRYSQRVRNANNEMRGLNTNLGKASSSMRTFVGALGTGKIGSLTSSLQGLSSAFGGLGSNIGGLQTSLAGMQGGLTALINPFTAISAAVVGGSVAWFKFNENLDATTRKVQEFLGVSRDVAMPIRNTIQAIADTYSVEFKDVLKSVDSLMNQFGIDANRALDIVSDGFAAGANENGNFLSLLQQYAPTFQDAGIGARELASYIAQTRSGIFNEDGLRLIAVAAKNIRNMSNSTRESLRAIGINADDMIAKLNSGQITIGQAISAISSKLGELNPQSQQVGAVLQDVFGKKGSEAGYKLVTSLANIETNLDKVKEQTGEWGNSMDKLKNANEELNNALSDLFGTANGGFDLIWTNIQTKGLTSLASLINSVRELKEEFEGLFSANARTNGESFLKLVDDYIDSVLFLIPAVRTLKKEIKGALNDSTGTPTLTESGEKTLRKFGLTDRQSLKFNQTTGGTSSIKSEPYIPEYKPTGKTPKSKSTPTVPKGIQAPTLTFDVNISQGELDREMEQWVSTLPSQLEEAKNKYAELFESNNAQSMMINNGELFSMFTDKIYEQAEAFGYYSQILGSVSQALGVLGDSAAAQAVQFGVNTAAILANAAKEVIAMRATAMANGIANAMKLPFPANLAEWAILASTIASVFSSLPSFAEGGIINGTRTIGDMNLARVNDGEMIFNSRQQKNLFNLVNSGVLGGGSDSNQTVHFRVSGNDLVGVLNNYNNKRSKAR